MIETALHENIDSVKLNNLMDAVLHQYQHIINEQDVATLSSENIIEYIVRYYEDIISCMPGNVYWLDKHGIAIGCNKNVLDMFGLKNLAEFKGLTFEAMGRIGQWSVEATQSFKNDTLNVIHTGKPKLNIEEPAIPHHDGRIIYFLTSRVPLFDQTGRVIGVVGISVDISEHKRTQLALEKAKERAEAASHAKSEFLANMSHDVKTPLSGIIGIAELLSARVQGEDREFAHTLLASGRQLLSFFDNCLEVFKLENGDITLLTEIFNLKDVLDEICDLFKPAVRAKELALNIYFHDLMPNYILASRAGIYRTLLNLVGNAVKFTHQGSITISADFIEKNAFGEAKIQLTVKDTGIGIAKNKQKDIFERFTRLIPSYKGTYEGSGIGLYIVQKFVMAMQGEVYVNSEEGMGSEFVVLLPVQIATKKPISSDKNATRILLPQVPYKKLRSAVTEKQAPKILLVEDNTITQWMQSSLLSSIGCQVEVVDSGEKVLEVFEPGKYDLIFMDLGLPGMQGDAVSNYIRKREEGGNVHVPIIALTAHTTESISKHCLTTGMDCVFSKPLLRDQIKQIIDHYL